ncbi:MAG: hypothetical protein CMO43_12650 [Verrucomicrobiales bacterium]|nr:hypothetical protein [Verrucomicrobiales bacterium]
MLVVCNGMPRAGSTLQWNLVCELAEATGYGAPIGATALDSISQDGVDAASRGERIYVVKQHDVWPGLIERVQRNEPGIRVCYIYRDLRDVAVSMQNKWSRTWEALLQALDEAVTAYEALVVDP